MRLRMSFRIKGMACCRILPCLLWTTPNCLHEFSTFSGLSRDLQGPPGPCQRLVSACVLLPWSCNTIRLPGRLKEEPVVTFTLAEHILCASISFGWELMGWLAKNKETDTFPKSSPCDQGTGGNSVGDLPWRPSQGGSPCPLGIPGICFLWSHYIWIFCVGPFVPLGQFLPGFKTLFWARFLSRERNVCPLSSRVAESSCVASWLSLLWGQKSISNHEDSLGLECLGKCLFWVWLGKEPFNAYSFDLKW